MTKEGSNTRPIWVKVTVLTLAICTIICLVLLGNWQMRRLEWKLNLIERVKARAYADPVSPPSGQISEKSHEYLRVKVSGRYLHDKTILVKAVTELGPGYWVMTPLVGEMKTYWINRGFVPQKLKSSTQWANPLNDVSVVGLLRISEPKGTYLEKNEPIKNSWYSRDVKAMSDSQGIKNALTYFIDRGKFSNPNQWPRPGLTVLKFRNNHLPYALTWYTMAILLTITGIWVAREL